MNADVLKLLERQAEWQRSRAELPWAEKLRQAITLRQSMLTLSNFRRKRPKASSLPSRSRTDFD